MESTVDREYGNEWLTGKKLDWETDSASEKWAAQIALLRELPWAVQDDGAGSELVADTWLKHLDGSQFPDRCRSKVNRGYLLPSPENIMHCFATGDVLAGLALVIGWGGMTRTKNRIYSRNPADIRDSLKRCQELICAENSIRGAWCELTGNLGWTAVMTSKTLHFLCRSLGYTANPPVPIDNKVILRRVWPVFMFLGRSCGAHIGGREPCTWMNSEDSWSGFMRYMSVIRCWAEKHRVCTTGIECTLFGLFEWEEKVTST